MELKLSNEARSNLREISFYTYLNWGKNQTIKYLSGLNHKLDLIATLPYLGRVFYYVNGVELRKSGYEKHLIMYFIHDETIVIYQIKNHRQQ